MLPRVNPSVRYCSPLKQARIRGRAKALNSRCKAAPRSRLKVGESNVIGSDEDPAKMWSGESAMRDDQACVSGRRPSLRVAETWRTDLRVVINKELSSSE